MINVILGFKILFKRKKKKKMLLQVIGFHPLENLWHLFLVLLIVGALFAALFFTIKLFVHNQQSRHEQKKNAKNMESLVEVFTTENF